MDKHEIIKQYVKPEERLLVAKILDKIEICQTKNKFVNTDFLDMYEKSIAEKIVKGSDINYLFYGGFEGAERAMLVIYPDKLTTEIVENMCNKLIKIVRIVLPAELHEKYMHKNYLGAVMKLGIKREKVGDIRVCKEGADIIVSNDIAEFVKDNYCGYIIPFTNNLPAFKEKIDFLYNNPEALAQMKQNAIKESKKYSPEFAWTIINDKFN